MMIVFIRHAHHDVERRDVDVDSKPGRLESLSHVTVFVEVLVKET